MAETVKTPDIVSEKTPKEVAIASSLIPYPRDDERARYLGYMACGLSVREALQMVGRSKQALSYWRLDQTFVDIENRLPEIRRELSKEYVSIEFFRNFRLVLEKDYRVLRRSLGMEKDNEGEAVSLTNQDQSYLLKMRSNYNPQQLSILEAIISDNGEGGFDFSRFIADNPDLVHYQETKSITVKQ